MCIVDFIDLCITNSLLFFSFSSSGKYKKALNRVPKTKNPSSSEQGEAAPSENLKQGSAQKKRLGQKFRFSFCLANGFLSLFFLVRVGVSLTVAMVARCGEYARHRQRENIRKIDGKYLKENKGKSSNDLNLLLQSSSSRSFSLPFSEHTTLICGRCVGVGCRPNRAPKSIPTNKNKKKNLYNKLEKIENKGKQTSEE